MATKVKYEGPVRIHEATGVLLRPGVLEIANDEHASALVKDGTCSAAAGKVPDAPPAPPAPPAAEVPPPVTVPKIVKPRKAKGEKA